MPKYCKRRGLPTALVYAGVVRTEGVGRPVREGGYSSFRTQSFPQGHTFLCVASRIGDVLGVRTFVVTASHDAFSYTHPRLFLGALSHLAPWSEPIYGLQLVTASLVLPTCTITLDKSQHFELGTFLNRRHFRHLHLQPLGNHTKMQWWEQGLAITTI